MLWVLLGGATIVLVCARCNTDTPNILRTWPSLGDSDDDGDNGDNGDDDDGAPPVMMVTTLTLQSPHFLSLKNFSQTLFHELINRYKSIYVI